jgi:hypothetical protein
MEYGEAGLGSRTTRPRDEGNQNPPEQNPNFSERNPRRMEQIPNFSERNPNSKPWISFAELSLIKGLRRPRPTIFRAFVTPNLLVLRSRAQLASRSPTRTTDAAHRTILRDAMLHIPPQDEESGDTREGRRCLFASTFRSFCLRFGSSSFLKQVKGWRHFDRGTLGRHFHPTWRPRASLREKGNPPRAKSPRTGEKDRPIDPTSGKKFARKRARTGFRAYTSGWAPALHCLKSISRSLPSTHIPSVSPIARRMRPLSVGRVEHAFRPAKSYCSRSQILLQCISEKHSAAHDMVN